MPLNDRHTMVLVTTHASGADEWYCPTCGRRFLMQWPPKYKRTILEPGDDYATHVGGKGAEGLSLDMAQSNVSAAREPVEPPVDALPEDETYLAPWLQWMDKVDFGKHWNN